MQYSDRVVDVPVVFIDKIWTSPSSCSDKFVQTVGGASDSVMKFEAVVKAFLPHFAAFFGLFFTELSPGLQLTF